MKSFTFEYANSTQLASNLNNVASWAQKNNISKIWLQVYVMDEDGVCFQPIADTINLCLPQAQYVMTSAGMAFSTGCITKTSALIVCNLFEDPTTQVELFQYPFSPADFESTVNQVIDYVQQNKWIRLISFNTGASVEGVKYMNKLAETVDLDIVISGGAAATPTMEKPPKLLSSNGEISTDSLVMTFIGGENFHARADVSVGWKGIGKEFTVTKSEGPVVYEIDGKPAFDLYRKYFKLKMQPGMVVSQTIEFPFCYEDDGMLFLRCPFILNEDGSIVMMLNDLNVGKKIRLSFGSPDVILEEIMENLDDVATFEPQVISVNSCLGRYFFWGDNIVNELSIFSKISAANGFLTGGELLRRGKKMLIFNETIITTAMREGEKSADGSGVRKIERVSKEYSLTQRLATFIDTVTSDLEEYNKTVKRLAITDSMTGLNNRREIEDIIEEIAAKEKPYSLLMLDADNFKTINDTYGNREGDKVLCLLADTIRSVIKNCPAEAFAGRWGGDEFMIVVEEDDMKQSEQIAKELQKRFHSLDTYEKIARTISIGLAHVNEKEDVESIFQRVDEKLYLAKTKGKGCIVQ